MKRFKFRLEAVETLRKRKEDEALQLLARVRNELNSITNRKLDLQKDLERALIRRENLASNGANADSFAIEESFISGTKQRIRQTELHESKASRLVERATRNYLHAKRDTKVIETLKDRELEEFKKEKSKKEMKEMDDLSSVRSARERNFE